MARIRTIKPEFPHSESMGRISRDARLTFIQLWTLADDSGRLRGNSRMLASLLFPYDDDAPKLIDTWLEELERERCIVRYAVDGTTCMQVCNWLTHQKIDKPSPSKLPEFVEASRSLAKPREHSSEDQGSRVKDLDQGSRTGRAAAQPADDTEFVLLQSVFPKRGGSQRWPDARSAINARMREGHTYAEFHAGAGRYAAYIRALCKERSEFVLQAATFFGPNKHFLEPWDIPASKAESRLAANVDVLQQFVSGVAS